MRGLVTQAGSSDPAADPGWIEFAVEPVKWFLEDRTEGRTQEEVSDAVGRDPLFQDAVAYCTALAAYLRESPGAAREEILAVAGPAHSIRPPAA
ncbi:hypothetical protein [Streptomyces sp. NPDC005408]|uniref:hypothetical protein n=1 Tax=Streptomyces sp. NPDC005408 TaxID=3155341 RepID=UPI0033BE8BA5